MTGSILGGGHAHRMTVSHIEFGPVSRADKAEAFELSISERSTVVGAEIFDAIDFVTVTHEDHKPVLDFEGLGLPVKKFVKLANIIKIGVADDRSPFSSRVIRSAGPVERSLLRALLGPTRW